MPPVEDGEVIQRIRATNAKDAANDLSTWMCRRCKKGASETPSAMSSREPTVLQSSASRKDRKTSSYSPPVTDIITSTSATSVTSTVDVRVKQVSSTAVDARPFSDRERNKKSDRQELTEAAPMKRILSPVQSRDKDVEMEGTGPTKSTPREKKISSQESSSSAPFHHQGKSARKYADTASTTTSEDDAQMQVEVMLPGFSESTSRATSSSQAPQAPSSDNQAIWPASVSDVPPLVHTASSTNKREREVGPVDGAPIQPPVNQDTANVIDDDPDDLYGPPVERRIIRILPSLAQELREQQRRVAAEKEKQRAPLAPDWIIAKHIHDPLWKEIPTEGRKRRKPTAKKLGDNGLNVNELMGCFTVQNWVREHKT
ncbi:hypothetical protein J3R82DRAFT_9477 [Butyriboletus roseoflavus]|nr:hypothetical protein J3R82DRAFT_9477 [Butyriboletus roseoflavus]